MTIIRPTLPGGYVIYCDDLREEVGGKTSLMGTYGGEMTIFGSSPVRLPKLCALVAVRLDPAELPPEFTLRILRLGKDEEIEVMLELQAQLPDAARQIELPAGPPDTKHFMEMRLAQSFEGIEFAGPCTISTRVEIGNDEYRLGSLDVKIAPREEAPQLIAYQEPAIEAGDKSEREAARES